MHSENKFENKSCTCPTHHKVRINNPHYPLLSSLLIALLPKCPFCIMAYSSAITVCGAKSMSEFFPQWTSWISISLSLATLGIVAWNYKGMKTIIACLLILSGVYLIIQSELFTGRLTSYYWGCTLLFIGVWQNGSLSWFVKRIFPKRFERLIPHG